MKVLIITLLSLSTTFAFGQFQSTWVGGTPGKENVWNEARNWNTNRVPDANTHVLIKKHNSGHFAQPIVRDVVEVASIEMGPGSTLKVEAYGEINIDGENIYTQGIINKKGQIINNGIITMINIDAEYDTIISKSIAGSGLLMIDGTSIAIAKVD